VLAADDPGRGQRPAKPERLALHRRDRQLLGEPARRPRSSREHDPLGLDARPVREHDAVLVELDDVCVHPHDVAEERGQSGDDAPRIDLRVLRQEDAAAAVGRDAGLERPALVAFEPLAAERLVACAVEREDERAAARVTRVDARFRAELTGERRPQLGRAVRERGEPGRLRIGSEHACGGGGRTAAGAPALEHTDVQAALRGTPGRREADDPAARRSPRHTAPRAGR